MAKPSAKIRTLILSDSISTKQNYYDGKYIAPYDVELETSDLNKTHLKFSLFDYDVSIIHIVKPDYSTSGYYANLPKILQDASIALEHGRTVICLPESEDFISEDRGERGMRAFEWLRKLGIEIQDNIGENLKPSGAGRVNSIEQYLKTAQKYYQIVRKPDPNPQTTLAVVDGTNIAVGYQHKIGAGTLVILPPPLLEVESYHLSMSRLMDVIRRYYERNQRQIFIGEVPEWLDSLRSPTAKALNKEIQKLAIEKSKYDQIEYVVYGTGEQLENSIELLLTEIGLTVERQPKGANIDLKAKYPKLGYGFAVEVTGTKGKIQKDSDKIAQSWQYLSERAGTPEEGDRFIVIANTQYHLDPTKRQADSFTEPVVKLLGDHGVLLITTLQLYELWKEIFENRAKSEDVLKKLHESSGLFQK